MKHNSADNVSFASLYFGMFNVLPSSSIGKRINIQKLPRGGCVWGGVENKLNGDGSAENTGAERLMCVLVSVCVAGELLVLCRDST